MAQRLILDTNIWLDWLVFEDRSIAPLRDAFAGRAVELLATARMQDELLDVLKRPFLAPVYARKSLQADELMRQQGELVTLCATPEPCLQLRCRDKDDQMFLDLAAAQRADALLSKDKLLLKLAKPARRLFGLIIARPVDYLFQPS